MNDIIPFKGYAAVNLCGAVFVRRDWWKGAGERERRVVLMHEAIHTAQQRELLYIGFFLVYLLEWVYRLVFHTKTAYRGISFEREAYANERNFHYLETRKHFAQWRH